MVESGFDADIARVNRRRKLAEAVAGSSFDAPQQTQMVGSGPYQVAVPNYSAPIAQIAKAMYGSSQADKADAEEKQIRQTRRADVAKAMTSYWPALQDPNSTPEARQAAALGLSGTLEPEDLRGASAQLLKSALDPREVQSRRVAQVNQDITSQWRGGKPKPGPRLTPTADDGQGQLIPVQTDIPDEAMPTAVEQPVEDLPDTESPEYYQYAAQRYEAAGLPQEAEKARKEAEKQVRESKKEKRQKGQDDWKIISGMRDDFSRDTKDMFSVRDSYSRVLKSAEEPSAAGDLSMIFAYMKILDPNSVVREGEFATAQNAGSVPQSIIGMYNKIVNGERLAPELRADFVNRAHKLYAGAEEQYQQVSKSYDETARRLGQDPANIIKPLVRPGAKAAPSAPKAAQKAGAEETKALGDKTYVKRNGQWFEVVK